MEEMKAFLRIIFAMGIIDLPKFHDYWSKTGICRVPWFPNIMNRSRFFQIMSNLHLVDNTIQNKDKLKKLGDLPQKLNEKFKRRYLTAQNLAIDEQLIGTRCRINFIQYMPKKPTKFGINVWALCEAMTGYCQSFQIYTGKVDGATEHGLAAHRVVFDLLEPYFDKHHHVYWDNFYSTKHLFEDLETRMT